MRRLTSPLTASVFPRRANGAGHRACASAAKTIDSLLFPARALTPPPASPPVRPQARAVLLTTEQFAMAREAVRAECELQWRIAREADEAVTLLRTDPGCPRELINEAQRRRDALVRAAAAWDDLLNAYSS